MADATEEQVNSEMRRLKKKDPNYLLLQTISLIWTYLKKRQKDKLQAEFAPEMFWEIAKYLDQRVFILKITAQDEVDAYIVFERINDRGISLNTMDLLKGFIFEKAGDDLLEEAKQQWTMVNDHLSSINSNEKFLNHYWNSTHGRVNKDRLFRDMRTLITDPSSAITFVRDLHEGAKLYAALNNPGDSYWDDHMPQTRENIKVLNLFDVGQAFPILMAAAQTFDVDEFRKLTELLVVMAIRYNYIGENPTGILSNYYVEIPRKISKNELKKAIQVFREIKSIYPKDDDFKRAFSSRAVKEENRARYLLGKLEDYPLYDDPKKVNLEHILPKNPNQEWAEIVKQIGKDDLQDYIYRLGNQALTLVSIHRGTGSKGFEIKRQSIYREETVIQFTKMLGEYLTWSKTEIEDRQAKLAGKAVRVWRIEDNTPSS